MSSLGITGWFLFSAFGLQHIEGGRGAIVAYTMPVWAALMSAVYSASGWTRGAFRPWRWACSASPS